MAWYFSFQNGVKTYWRREKTMVRIICKMEYANGYQRKHTIKGSLLTGGMMTEQRGTSSKMVKHKQEKER